MKLTQEQINFYHENGYLILDKLFDKSEIEVLANEALKFNDLKKLPNIILEENGEVRSVFAPHTLNEGYENLYLQDRLVVPSKQLLDTDIYLYQYKLNNKKAFVGDWWEWHQDFPYWHMDDGVKFPEMISAFILLQDTTTLQGPLIIIPRSHKNGIVDFEPKGHLIADENNEESNNLKSSLGADLKYTIRKRLIEELINENGFQEVVGEAGTCCFFHPNLFHASNSNISPFDRNTAIVTYNSINNLPSDTDANRPDYVCSRDFEPIVNVKFK